MKIAQVAPLYESVPPKLYGGTERIVSYITEELVRQCHDVTLFASGDSMTSAELVPMCPEALRLNDDVIDPLAHHVRMVEEVFRRKNEFDIIHFHIDYLHYPLSSREKVPNVTTLHGRLDMRDLVPLYRTYPEMPVISISDAQRRPLPWLNWQGTVHHGMPEDRLSIGSGGGDYLAFLGRISPEKGLDEAIRIARRVGVPLKIAAKVDRVDQKYFDTVIKSQLDHELIEYIGEIGYAEKNEFLGNATALLFPIAWPEPFGLVMMEAMACGTPVIAYARGSVPEVIEDGLNGFIVRDVDGAASAIERLGRLDRLRCRQRFEERFTAKRMSEDYMAIYERLVAQSSKSFAKEAGLSVA
jgi:glycosyltransferase involved in cell wall biosynthesis